MRAFRILLAVVVGLLFISLPAGAQRASYTVFLSGSEAVPPVSTKGLGIAVLEVAPDRSALQYRLIVGNLVGITMAHIHVAPPGQAGPIVAWLFPSSPPPTLIPGRFHGTLASGTIRAENLTGPLAGRPLSALLEAIERGNAYVNVHTQANPAGEIRAQIR
jgi:hypothetical protein